MAECLFPFHVRNPRRLTVRDAEWLPVPCGKCPACLNRRASFWSFRLTQEDKVSSNGVFVTLTYDEDNMSNNITDKGFMSLNKRDWQLFMKRLRKMQFGSKRGNIKYYMCGEYGSQTFRPHYHAIIFNVNPDFITDAWDKGHVVIGNVSGASIAYTLKYMSKGKLIPVHANDDRLPEFSLMSRGIGYNYMSDEMVRYHQEDISRCYVTVEDNIKVPMPRIFREKIYTKEQRSLQGYMVQERVNASEAKRLEEFVKRTGSAEGYDKAVFESKKQAIDVHRARSSKRNKV